MRWIANLIITSLVLWAMTAIFPNQVQIDGFWKIALAAFLLWAIELAIQLIAMGLVATGVITALTGGCLLIIAGIVIVIFAKVIALSILDSHLSGFTMTGFWIKLLTAFVCSLLCINPPQHN